MTEVIASKLYNDPTYSLPIYDIENENDEPLGNLTQESMLKAFEIAYTCFPDHFHNLIQEEYDAETADVFFQLAVMGDVFFG